MTETIVTTEKIIDLNKWSDRLPEIKDQYQQNKPYPHIALDNFLEDWAARKAMSEFPAVKADGWIHYVHVNEKKHGLNKVELLPPFIQVLIERLNSTDFVNFLSQLTGIENLLPDPKMEGGGLHQTERGGYLNIHADFTIHPHKRNWQRRVNLLIYLNDPWEEEYGGHLELWDRDMSKSVQSIAPLFNRCVIFNTDEDSFHGQPNPLQCPEGMSRKSIALYYFTEEKEPPRRKSTNYRGRPQDGMKKLWIYLDKKLVEAYSSVKGLLGINDDFISKVLNTFGGKKK